MPDDSSRNGAPVDHLSSLYRLAQALTPDAEAAAHLVEATYRRAAAAGPSPETADRLRLFRLMTQLHAEGSPGESVSASRSFATEEAKAPDFRRRAALRFLERHLPAAFAALAPQERLLLLLCKVEQLSCADAGQVLGMNPDEACARLAAAYTTLRRHVHAQASETERRLLDGALPSGGLRTALRQFVEADFAAPPADLEPSVAEVVQEQRRASRAARPDEATRRRTIRRSTASALPPDQRVRRALAALLVIAAAGLLGWGTTSLFQTEPTTSLVALSAEHDPAQARQTFQPDTPAEAERLIRRALGRRVPVPEVAGASLSGVHIAEVAPEVAVPVFLFDDSASRVPLRVYAYTYALLDRFGDRLRLDADTQRRIEDTNGFEVQDLGEENALVWRHRANIFVALTPGDAEALGKRLGKGERESG